MERRAAHQASQGGLASAPGRATAVADVGTCRPIIHVSEPSRIHASNLACEAPTTHGHSVIPRPTTESRTVVPVPPRIPCGLSTGESAPGAHLPARRSSVAASVGMGNPRIAPRRDHDGVELAGRDGRWTKGDKAGPRLSRSSGMMTSSPLMTSSTRPLPIRSKSTGGSTP